MIDNAGTYDAVNGTITLLNFTGTILNGAYIRVVAKPANPSVISPLRNNIVRYDNQASRARAVITDTL